MRQQTRTKFLQPELFLSEALKNLFQSKYLERDESLSFLYRASVVAVDVVGGQLQNEKGQGGVTHSVDGKESSCSATVGPRNPRNSVKARIISRGRDQFFDDDSLRVFWPMLPEHISVPIKPGEHVYVLFEDSNFDHGLWFGKVPGHENLNRFKGQDSFKDGGGSSLVNSFPDTRGVSQAQRTKLNTDVAASERLASDGRLAKRFPNG